MTASRQCWAVLCMHHIYKKQDQMIMLLCCYAAGLVTADDMQIMLRQLAGSSLTDDDISCLVRKALQEADSPQGLTLEAFKKVLKPQDLQGMVVEVPTEL
eukprot:GHRR01034121.1.p2 GENE.GHRR01034121.1~~GHRR01034121.1.p2  ORF type:complete len:100 (+),score=33.10 GHRR01034121.1:273-572(+)